MMIENVPVSRQLVEVGQNAKLRSVRAEFCVSPINQVLLTLGSFFHLVAEGSFLPLVTGLIYFFAGVVLLYVTRLTSFSERRIYNRMFSIGFFVAGISALYRTFALDMQGDAAHFFEMASDLANNMSLLEIAVLTEGSIAVVLWREVFNFMAILGFPRQPFVGIFVNVLMVALTAVLTQRMVLMIYGNDDYRSQRLMLIYSFCGVLWVFSGLLLRDSVVLLAVTSLTCAWIFFLKKPDIGRRFFFIICCSVLATACMGFMRTKFIFIPLVMAIFGLAALVFGHHAGRTQAKNYFFLLVFLMVVGWVYGVFFEELNLGLTIGRENYTELSFSESSSDSLGYSIVVNQPILLRVFIGSVYLFVMPVPFWAGLQLESAYSLFKSFNSLYFLFLIPLLIIAIRYAWRDKSSLRSSFLFLIFVAVGFTISIAATSIETRHHAAFFPIFFLLALLPDLRVRTVRRQYWNITVFLFLFLLIGHLMWLALKWA